MLARAVQTFANDLHQISDAIKGRTVTQIKGALQKKAFDEAGIVIQHQVQVSSKPHLYPQLHFWNTAFFTLRIQILSFLGKITLNRKWPSDFPLKEKH